MKIHYLRFRIPNYDIISVLLFPWKLTKNFTLAPFCLLLIFCRVQFPCTIKTVLYAFWFLPVSFNNILVALEHKNFSSELPQETMKKQFGFSYSSKKQKDRSVHGIYGWKCIIYALGKIPDYNKMSILFSLENFTKVSPWLCFAYCYCSGKCNFCTARICSPHPQPRTLPHPAFFSSFVQMLDRSFSTII